MIVRAAKDPISRTLTVSVILYKVLRFIDRRIRRHRNASIDGDVSQEDDQALNSESDAGVKHAEQQGSTSSPTEAIAPDETLPWDNLPSPVPTLIIDHLLKSPHYKRNICNFGLTCRAFGEMVKQHINDLKRHCLTEGEDPVNFLKQNSGLWRLSLSLSEVEPAGLSEALSGLQRPRELRLENFTSSTATCNVLKKMLTLKMLELRSMKLPSLEFLSSLTHLRKLSISDCCCDAQDEQNSSLDFEVLQALPNLEWLDIKVSKLNDDQLFALSRITSDLSVTLRDADSMHCLADIHLLTSLTKLDVTFQQLSVLPFQLNALPRLKQFAYCVSDLSVRDMENLKSVRDSLPDIILSLQHSSAIKLTQILNHDLSLNKLVFNTDELDVRMPITAECPSLKSLHIKSIQNVSHKIFHLLDRFPNLEELSIGDCLSSVDEISELPRLCPKLKYLVIGLSKIKGKHLCSVAQLKALRDFKINGAPFLETLSPLNESHSLKHLALKECPQIEQKIEACLQEPFLENLKVLEVYLTPNMDPGCIVAPLQLLKQRAAQLRIKIDGEELP